MDTQRMLQPQGLFQSPRPFQPQPWPGSGPGAGAGAPGSLYAPPLPSGPGDPMSATLPRGMEAVPPGGPYSQGGQFHPGGQFPQGGFPPGGQFPQGGFPPGGPGMGGNGPRLRLPGGPRTPAVIAGVLVLVVATVIVVALHGGSSPSGTTAGGIGTTAGSTPTAAAPASNVAQRQAATQLSGLLAQSGTDRGAVTDAVVSVQNCGKGLGKDARTFTTAAHNRRSLLSRLGSLPGRSALPAAMVSALTGAWQASAQADSDLARWAAAAASHGCHKGNANNASLKASYGPDGQATADKQAFARLWKPLARRYGLPAYQWEQI